MRLALLLIFLCTVIPPKSANAQWQPANGPGGTVTCVASCPDGSGGTYIFAGTTNGVIRSTDNGLTWTSVSNGLAGKSVNALAVSQNGTGGYSLFAGTGVISQSGTSFQVVNGGVFVSTDNGADWSDAGLDTIFVTSLAAYPNGAVGCDIFAGAGLGSACHLFSSTNSGTSWSCASLDSVPVWSVDSYPNGADKYSLIVASGMIQSTGRTIAYLGGAYRSTDNGASWNCLWGGYANSVAVEDSNIYAGTYDGLYCSSNNGTTWSLDTITYNGFPLTSQYSIPTTSVTRVTTVPDGKGGTVLFAGITFNNGIISFSALMRSTDNGVSWSCLLPRAAAVASVPNAAGGQTLFATGAILLRSTDNGASWQTSNVSLADANVSFLEAVPNGSGGSDLMAPCYPSLVRSTDDGATWTTVDTTGLMSPYVNAGVGAFSFAPNSSGGTNFHIACYGKEGSLLSNLAPYVKFYESTDNGSSWFSPEANDSNMVLYDNGLCLATVPNGIGGYNILESGALASNSLHLSTDNGSTWQAPTSSLNAYSFVLDDSIVYAINGGINCSTDGGLSWTAAGNTGYAVSSLAAKSGYLLAGTVQGGVFLSTDSGTTWNAINSGVLDSVVANSEVSSVGITPDGSGGYKFFAGTCPYPVLIGMTMAGSHLFMSTDLGATWGDVSTGLPTDGAITNLLVQPDKGGTPYLYAGFGQPYHPTYPFPSYGVWRRPLAELIVGVKQQPGRLPSHFSLEQNYPNPFNPSTIISYQLPTSSHVTLKIYDILGRETGTLVDARQTAGSHSVTFDAGKLPSGVYFYRLQAGNYTATKKLLLLK